MIKINFDNMYIPPWMLNALENHGINPEGKSYLECEKILAQIPRHRVQIGPLLSYDPDDDSDFDCPF